MKLKQKLYDLLDSHKAKVGEARTAAIPCPRTS